jgi:hypothetical protein
MEHSRDLLTNFFLITGYKRICFQGFIRLYLRYMYGQDMPVILFSGKWLPGCSFGYIGFSGNWGQSFFPVLFDDVVFTKAFCLF